LFHQEYVMKKFALIAALGMALMVPAPAEAACRGKGRVRNALAKIVAVVRPGRHAEACGSCAAAGACANGTCVAK
jgi:hypothetical protein